MRRAALFCLLLTTSAFAGPVSFRAGLGLDRTRATALVDADCSATTPPALFGCGAGVDGHRLAARGDFGNAEVVELGAAWDVAPRARLELLLAHRNGVDLDARANFLGVAGEQPVSANATSTAALVTGTWLFGTPAGARPFVMAGAGAARNEIGAIAFAFPGIAPGAATTVRGGASTELAYTAGAGIAFAMTDRIDLDVALRYTSLGKMHGDAGAAIIVRPRGVTVLDIAGTEARLDTIGVMLSLRFRP